MLTRSGLGAVVTAVCLVVFGVWWGYEELVVAGAGVGAVVVAALWVARQAVRTTVDRRVVTVRVPRGDHIGVTYRVRNPSRFRSGRATIIDQCDDALSRTEIVPLPPATAIDVFGDLPTHRRGVFQLGPLDVERIDPLWLAVGTRRYDVVGSVTVHPKVYRIIGPQGALRVVESDQDRRRATIDPLCGFVSMREYAPGDDPRLIHWPTTARTGTLMIRENFEVRRPEFTVVLDTSADAFGSDDDFEEAVDAAATLASHAIRTGLDVVVRTTSRVHPGRPNPLVDESTILDLLTPVQLTGDADLLAVATLFAGGFDHTSVVMITGTAGPSSRFASLEQMLVVRVGADAVAVPGVAVAAADAHEFVMQWRSWT